MGYVLEGVAYVAAVLLVGLGVYFIMQGAFPGWWRRRAWPVVEPTRGVARLQGIGIVVLGLGLIAIVFTTEVPKAAGGALVIAAIAGYVIALALFVLSVAMSRRPAA